jgi:hypothetical protein
MRVNGRMTDGDSVVVDFVPYVFLGPDSTALRPEIQPSPVASAPASP